MLSWKLISSGQAFDLSILSDSRRLTLFGRTLYLAFSVAVVCGIVGVITAIFLNFINKKQQAIMTVVFFLPLLIPPFIHGIAWPNFLFKFGIQVIGECWLVVLLVLSYYPIVMALTINGINSIDLQLWDSARLRHGKFKTVMKIILPLALKNIAIGITIVFLLTLSEYGLASVMQVNTYPVEIMTEFSAFYDEAAAIKLCLPLILPIVAALITFKTAVGKGLSSGNSKKKMGL